MRTSLLTLVVCAGGLCGQKFSWQDACFKNPALPYCQGRDFAVKPPPSAKGAAAPRSVVTSPSTAVPRTATPSMIVVGALDWRFADPFADELAGFNFGGLSASPLARSLVARLGAKQGLAEADIQKIFDALDGVDQVALSVRDNRVVVMITGRVANSALPAPEAGLKAAQVSGNAMLFGHPDAVDQAMRRMTMNGPANDLMRLAEERQASSEFWAMGSARLMGAPALSAGVKRFFLAVSIHDRLMSDLAFEFSGVPNEDTMRTLQTTLGAATLEGNLVHVRTSMEAGEVQQKFGQVLDSPVGERLAALIEAARYLPARDAAPPKSARPIIYGLDDGLREVSQDSIR